MLQLLALRLHPLLGALVHVAQLAHRIFIAFLQHTSHIGVLPPLLKNLLRQHHIERLESLLFSVGRGSSLGLPVTSSVCFTALISILVLDLHSFGNSFFL